MSLYNINGVDPATFYLLPMLDKHPDEYPRFRDCFEEDGKLHVLTDLNAYLPRLSPAPRIARLSPDGSLSRY